MSSSIHYIQNTDFNKPCKFYIDENDSIFVPILDQNKIIIFNKYAEKLPLEIFNFTNFPFDFLTSLVFGKRLIIFGQD